jgi:copper(I)-binding protein
MLCWIALAGPTYAAPDASALQVRDAWVRWLPAELPAGGYLTLVNSSDHPASLVAASSPDYAEVSLHRSRTVDGASRMGPVHEIAVAAHSSLAFAAHGYHLMLLHPTKPLKPGDHVPVTLMFAGGAALTVQFELRPPAAGAAAPDMADMPGMSH